MTEEGKKYFFKVNMDKAKNKTRIAIFIILVSIMTYIIPILEGILDFGVIFESVSLIFIIIAKRYMLKYNLEKARKYNFYAMLPIGWLFVYDGITYLLSAESFIGLITMIFLYIFSEILLIIYMLTLFLIKKSLEKAGDPEKYKESTDWFYEKYEEKENENENIEK